MDTTIRPAKISDAEQVNHIANWYIKNTVANFETAPWSVTERVAWLERFCRAGSPHRMLVSLHDDAVTGFACNTRFKPKSGYDKSTETTVYVTPGMTSKGIGEMLYRYLLEVVRQRHFHRAYAIISLPNLPSVRLHEKFGFHLIGVLDETGEKFGKFHDAGIYQKKF